VFVFVYDIIVLSKKIFIYIYLFTLIFNILLLNFVTKIEIYER